MKKKLLAGIMALALCSTSMPQMIFAEEFTSGVLEEATPEETEETPEVFTDENQAAAGDELGGVSEFSSEEVPEFDDEGDNVAVATDGNDTTATNPINIDINSPSNASDSTSGYAYDNSTSICTINKSGSYRFSGTANEETSNRIVIDNITSGTVNIYLNNVNINTSAGPALLISGNVAAQVYIYLEGDNTLKTTNIDSAALQKDNPANSDNSANLIITAINKTDSTKAGTLTADATESNGAGIGGNSNGGSGSGISILSGVVKAYSKSGAGIGGGPSGSASNIFISGGIVKASSTYGAGIGSGGGNGNGENIFISGGSVTAYSESGAGIGGGLNTSGINISISNASVTAYSIGGAGIGGGNNGGVGESISISGGSVTAYSIGGAGIGGGTYSYGRDISISGGSVTAYSESGAGIGSGVTGSYGTSKDISISGGSVHATVSCIPKLHKVNTSDSGTSTAENPDVYLCEISNPKGLEVTIDGTKRNPPYNHKAIQENNNELLYAWLTGKDHVVTVGNDKRKYSFISSSSTFTRDKADPTVEQFDVTLPSNLIYDGTPKNVSVVCKNDVEGMGNITVKYYKEGESTFSTEPPKAPGTYIVKIDVTGGTYYNSVSDLTNPDWKFTIRCTHQNTVNRYYSSASCTSSGYSGDTYCTDCGALVSSGYTISAYGHSYDDGVITTEPTAETDGVVTYTCKRCKHQKTRTLGKLNDGEPYIDGDFLSKGWDSVKEIIKKSKEKDLVSINLNGAQTLPASVLSELKGKDIDLSLNMENGFIWKINGASITAETPADVDFSVAKATDYIPASLYKLISTNQNDFAFHLGASGAFDFPMVLSVKTDASCAGLMANLFWYDAQNQILQCIQSVTVSGALERSIPYADFTLSRGQDYFVAFSTESLNGRSIHADGSITDENGSYLRPADTSITSCSVDRNKLTVKLSRGCAGAQGYDFVVGKSSNMTQTGKFSKTVSSQSKPQASFKYLAKGTWYVAARSWVLDEQGNKVYGSWSAVKKFKITVVTAQQPKIREVKVKGNTVTITYTKCKNADGYEIVLGTEYKTSTDEKYPVKKYVKRTKNTTTVTFTNVKKGTWYVGIRSWTQPSKAKYKTYSPYSAMKKFKIKK